MYSLVAMLKLRHGLAARHRLGISGSRVRRPANRTSGRRNEARRTNSANLVEERGRQSRGAGLRKLMTLTTTTIAEANDANASAANAHHSSANLAARAVSVADTGRL
jgi:hypothetical protein